MADRPGSSEPQHQQQFVLGRYRYPCRSGICSETVAKRRRPLSRDVLRTTSSDVIAWFSRMNPQERKPGAWATYIKIRKLVGNFVLSVYTREGWGRERERERERGRERERLGRGLKFQKVETLECLTFPI